MSSELQEIREAIDAGKQALNCLYTAQEKLKSAKNWGLFDLFGGGFITDMIKHSKMNDASRCMEDAKYHLRRFQKELRDVNTVMDIRLDVGEFLSFSYFFFDGLVADYLVQSKIADARRQIDEAILQVKNILARLEAGY